MKISGRYPPSKWLLLLGFMRGFDFLQTGDAAHRAFIMYSVDRLANGPFPELATAHKRFSSMDRSVFDTILSTVRDRYVDEVIRRAQQQLERCSSPVPLACCCLASVAASVRSHIAPPRRPQGTDVYIEQESRMPINRGNELLHSLP
jgi:hypothetical protein